MILGGQGGDEIFGGYTRYLIAYFEQCIKAAIDGTTTSGNFVVTYESIIPNLVALRNYKPLHEGVLAGRAVRGPRRPLLPADQPGAAPTRRGRLRRARRLLARSRPSRTIFNGDNVGHESYFDKMTHFDFKTLLPALLQVEDRVSMAHGLESRVPLLDHELVELAATIPADVKFKDGNDEARLQARDALAWCPTSIAEAQGQDGLPGAAPGVDARAGPGVRHRRLLQRAPRAGATCSTTAACSPGWSARTASAARRGACSASSCGSGRSTTASTRSRSF